MSAMENKEGKGLENYGVGVILCGGGAGAREGHTVR